MQDSLELLEWPTLFERLLAQCLTPYGEKRWLEETFLPDPDAMEAHLAEVDELKTLLVRYGDVTSETGLPDILPVIRRLEKQGDLSLGEIRRIMRVLDLGGKLIRHFARALKNEPQLRRLDGLLDESVIPDEVSAYLDGFIDSDGSIRDSASPALFTIRQRIRQQQQSMQHRIQRISSHPDYAPILQGNVVTEREGRCVFPVKVEYKSRLPGVIHGASASGATIYVEPLEIVEVNNAIHAFQAELQKEIERILREISAHLHPHWEALQRLTDALGHLDRRLAAARLSRLLNATPPALVRDEMLIDVHQARHPLLVLNYREKRDKPDSPSVIANDIHIGPDGVRTLVVTGPNTGGKTVLLKTIGLFACMVKAGLHLPVGEQSRISCFAPVLADIGDQQSIERNLSTFSAHMQCLQGFLSDEADLSRGLVLIDEIAAGTDPAEGAALARAVLDELYRKGAITVVTTHLGELKVDAHQHAGFANASVAFDAETLSPTYRLVLGVPGSSNAITIAAKLGLKQSVVDQARMFLGAPARESSELLQELETRNRQLAEELQSARSYREEAQIAYEKTEAARQRLEDEKRQVLKQFQVSVKSRIHEMENQLKELRRQLRQGEAPDPERMADQLKRLGRQADRAFGESRAEIARVAPPLTVQDLNVGDKVYSRQLEITGEVMALSAESGEVTVQAGILRMTVPASDLRKADGKKGKAARTPEKKLLEGPGKAAEGRVSASGESMDPDLTCDVRGQRAEEAMRQVEEFLDQAMLSGHRAVAVVHGLGTGALKREIRGYLAQSAYVKRFYPAQATRGGDGKTIIELAGG